MMNKRRRGRPPNPVIFGAPAWIPLQDAFFRIRDCLGSRTLAARDLHRDLLNGRLKGARRGFDSNRAEIEAVECDPDFWQGVVFKEGRWPLHHDGSDPGLYAWHPPEHPHLRENPHLCEMYVFVGRVELDRLYPEAKSEQTPVATGFPRKDNRGRKSKIDWAPVLVGAAGLMANHPGDGLRSILQSVQNGQSLRRLAQNGSDLLVVDHNFRTSSMAWVRYQMMSSNIKPPSRESRAAFRPEVDVHW
jgi:hypothetical protein